MKCQRAGMNRRIEKTLARHADLMERYQAEGMSRDESSKRAYREIVDGLPQPTKGMRS